MTDVVVVGGGIGGMVAALRARRSGADVTIVEARSQLGGLASPVEAAGLVFDGGPYILLDRVRLGWALGHVGIDLSHADLVELDPAYRLVLDTGRGLSVSSDLDSTVRSIEQVQAGAGATYRRFVKRAASALDRLAPLLVRPHGPLEPLRTGAWRAAPWAALSLEQLLRRHRITGTTADAVRIWTYIAGGDPERAPGPLALVPALIHRDGAARPARGIHRLVSMITDHMEMEGISVLTGTPVASINHDCGGVRGVTTTDGTSIDADVVISDIGAAAALLDLVDVRPPLSLRLRMRGPLQSPGMTAYLAVEGTPPCEINFRVAGEPKQATAFIAPPGPTLRSLRPARIVAPLSHDRARDLGESGQRELLCEMVDASWWRQGIDHADVVATRVVGDWAREFRLRDDAMNLIMARRQLLLGRLPHRIAHIPGLYLAGSWTHPGQWISFCAVSGVLAADRALDQPLVAP